MSDIDLSLNLYISPTSYNPNRTYDKHFNKRMNETCTNDWENMFHDTFHGTNKFSNKKKRSYILIFLFRLSFTRN